MPTRGSLFDSVAESSPIELQGPVPEAEELPDRVPDATVPDAVEPESPFTVHRARMRRDGV